MTYWDHSLKDQYSRECFRIVVEVAMDRDESMFKRILWVIVEFYKNNSSISQILLKYNSSFVSQFLKEYTDFRLVGSISHRIFLRMFYTFVYFLFNKHVWVSWDYGSWIMFSEFLLDEWTVDHDNFRSDIS